MKRTRESTGSRVTIQDVAELAGVSIATVSRVLNSHPDVSPATRAEVLRYVRELGYVSNRATETRATPRTRLIGLAAPSVRNDYVAEIVSGASDALHDRDARLIICSPGGNGDTTLRDRLMTEVTDGALLILPADAGHELLELRRSGYPFVVVEPAISIDEGIPSVAVTNWAGAKAATEHLIGLGHTHIGVITGPSEWRITADRVAGYHAALMAAGLPLVPHLIQEAGWTTEAGYEAAQRLLSLPHAPTAVFAVSDVMAIGVLRAARELGLNVPDDLSVVGFDDVELATITTPMLTTVQQPLQGLGRLGADMLCRLLDGQELDAMRIELSTRLIVRDSTAAPRGTSFLTI